MYKARTFANYTGFMFCIVYSFVQLFVNSAAVLSTVILKSNNVGYSVACCYTLTTKGARALRGKFGPLWSQKLKIAFQQFLLIGLLEE